VADSLLASKDSMFAWDSVIAVLGRQDPRAASKLVDRLGNDPRLSREARSRRLYDDGLRLAEVDSARAVGRLKAAALLAPHDESGQRARLRLLRLELSRTATLDELPPLGDSLAALATGLDAAASEAAALQGTVHRLRGLPDSAAPSVPLGDLRLFLGAEAARDSLLAPALATALFLRLIEDWPASPYAPKALLAAGHLDPDRAEAFRTRLDSLYPDSPYLAVARGQDAPGYRVLEDSLGTFAAAQSFSRARPPQGVRRRPRDEDEPAAPGQRPRPGRPADDDAPNRRRQPEP
jgi:hypothetical protein